MRESLASTGETNGTAKLTVEEGADVWTLRGSGAWTMAGVHTIDARLREIADKPFPALTVDTSNVSAFDTGGAWLIERLKLRAKERGVAFQHQDGDHAHEELVDVVEAQGDALPQQRGFLPTLDFNPIEAVGRTMVQFGQDFLLACHLIGASVRGTQLKARRGSGLRIIAVVSQLDKMGLRAVPVIAVMSFLVGCILAQQGAFHLKWYGEELLTVNLVGLLHLREIGVLLTAVMVAGRTGSSITAEVGTMKMREEIDALHVIGLNPVGVLIFPRLLALVIALPVLTLVADLAGMLGAMVIGDLYIGISPQQFLATLQAGVAVQHFYVGIIKAPFMALIIGVVAAIEGLKVGGSAESLGQHTTAAVVRSIFAVIIVNALFALFFAAIDY